MAKEVTGFIKLQIKAGAANPAPPVGPALGSKGLNIMDFCKQFNARTQDKAGKILPVVITVYSDKSFSFEVKQPPVAVSLKEAAKILIHHFMLFSDEKITLENPDQDSNQEFDEEVLHMRQLLKTKLIDMNLSVRALNCLKAADVETLGDLVQYNKTDLLKFRNFGKKSLSELDDLLEGLNLSFGTDISKYKLNQD